MSKIWWKYAGIRALYTIGETAIATIPTTARILEDVDWWIVLSSSLLAGLISFTKSMLIGMPEAPKTDIIVDSDRYE